MYVPVRLQTVMKKLFRFLVILAVLALAGFTALGFWLRPQVEEHVLQGFNNIALASGVKNFTASVEQSDFSPFSRRVELRGLTLRGETPAGSTVYDIAEFSYRLPLRMLLAYTPLRDLVLPETGMMAVAENVSVRNLALRTAQGQITIQREEINTIMAEPSLVLEALAQQPMDALDAVYRTGVDKAHAFFISVETPGPARNMARNMAGNMKMTIKEVVLKNWRGGTLEEVQLMDMRLLMDAQESAHMGHLLEKGVTLPNEDMLRRFLALAAQAGQDYQAVLPGMTALLEEMLDNEVPLVREVVATDLGFTLNEGSVTLKEVRFDWLSNKPRRTETKISGLSLPKDVLARRLGLVLPPLNLNAAFSLTEEGADARLEKGSLHAQGLGDLDYSLKVFESPAAGLDLQQALLLQSFSDFSASFTDHGLMAWLGYNVSPNPRAAAAAMLAAAQLPGLKETPANQAISMALQNFVQRPGKLELHSLPGKRLQILQLFGALGDPGALFSLRTTPGGQSLETQIGKLDAAR